MIEVYYKHHLRKKVASFNELDDNLQDILNVRVIDYTESELAEIAEIFSLNLNPLNRREDIEISSHYIELPDQLSLNFSIPSYSTETSLNEQDIHIIIKEGRFFVFLPAGVEGTVNLLTKFRYDFDSIKFNTYQELFVFQMGVIADYYADIVESISKKIKGLFYQALNPQQFHEKDLDQLTEINFSNFLLRESVSEFQRIILLLRKRFADDPYVIDHLSIEIDDLYVVSEHIQYNFDRISDLKTNINSKIELEQNRIFKVLTIITVCISLPTLIAGVYGMNFDSLPGLHWSYGYLTVLMVIILSFLLPLLFFKGKKWF